jgi:hypothetical protein
MPHDSETRWQTALHESGHLVTARALNRWDTECRAELYAVGGCAWLPLGLTEHTRMVSTAAGLRAERLSRLHPAPRRRPQPAPNLYPEVAVLREQATDSAQAAFLGQLTTDADELARYCIKFCPADPKDWARRFRRIHAAARLAVWIHRVEIVEVATRLFHEGKVSFPGCPSDNAFFSGGTLPTE